MAKKTGTCRNIRDCPLALANWRQKEIYPDFCDTVTRVVCCLPETGPVGQDRKSGKSNYFFNLSCCLFSKGFLFLWNS